MDLSHLLPSDFDITLFDCFSFDKGIWKAIVPLKEDDLFAVYSYDGKTMDAHVEDQEGERFTLFSLPNPGAFASKIREEVEDILSSLIFSISDDSSFFRDKVISLFKEKYKIEGEKPWKDDDESIVFRSSFNNKWIAIMLSVSSSKLGIPGEKKVDIVNIKHSQSDVPCVIDHHFIFPAWHMNKKTWITVLLSKDLDWDFFASLVEESRNLVEA
ncbi:MAG: MmcQ/YjbR family DNA-binding protein [Candidatus Ornithospirochaeta sp.]